MEFSLYQKAARVAGAGRGNRTPTVLSDLRILSPLRLPISPSRQLRRLLFTDCCQYCIAASPLPVDAVPCAAPCGALCAEFFLRFCRIIRIAPWQVRRCGQTIPFAHNIKKQTQKKAATCAAAFFFSPCESTVKNPAESFCFEGS